MGGPITEFLAIPLTVGDYIDFRKWQQGDVEAMVRFLAHRAGVPVERIRELSLEDLRLTFAALSKSLESVVSMEAFMQAPTIGKEPS